MINKDRYHAEYSTNSIYNMKIRIELGVKQFVSDKPAIGNEVACWNGFLLVIMAGNCESKAREFCMNEKARMIRHCFLDNALAGTQPGLQCRFPKFYQSSLEGIHIKGDNAELHPLGDQSAINKAENY